MLREMNPLRRAGARTIRLLAALSACFLLGLPGCGGGSSNTPGSISALITRLAGGTVALGNAASVTIPPNSLAGDTTITIQQTSNGLPAMPPAGLKVIGSAYDFSPNGTAFSPSATLTIAYDPANLAPGTSEPALQICTVANGQWQAVPNATVDTTNKRISVSISHFSLYAVLGPALGQ
jgi:hypothetical protein